MTGFPLLLAIVLAVARLRLSAVVVDHCTEVVGVALACVPHIRPRILKHGHDERNHVAVGVHVLDRLEHAGALPLPAVEQRLEVPAVAGPHSHDVAVQSLLVVAVLVDLGDECRVAALVVGVEVGEVVVDVVAGDGQANVLIGAQGALDVLLQLLNRGLGERHIGKILAQVHHHFITFINHGVGLELSYTHIGGQECPHHLLHTVHMCLVDNLLCLQHATPHCGGQCPCHHPTSCFGHIHCHIL